MRPGKEMDTRIAREIFGHEVWATNKTVHERAGDVKRPLRSYTREMEWAWEVADKMRITLIPVRSGEWFAFAAGEEGWESPQAFAEFLQAGNFEGCGAALGENAPLVICEAALRAAEKRRAEAAGAAMGTETSLQ
jgi:hypothetical protein